MTYPNPFGWDYVLIIVGVKTHDIIEFCVSLAPIFENRIN